MNFGKTCNLEYDTDKHILYIVKADNGTVSIINDGICKGIRNFITSFYIWNKAFGINAEPNTYDVEMQDDRVLVYFNKPLR